MDKRGAEGVLLTGVYRSGKNSVAEQIAYVLKRQDERYALLDLDHLGWAGTGTGDRAGEFGMMIQNQPPNMMPTWRANAAGGPAREWVICVC